MQLFKLWRRKAPPAETAMQEEEAAMGNESHQEEKPPFRFLDLPPEVRNYIYRELLISKESDATRCSPQILAACKQTSREATGYLYHDNTFHIFCAHGVVRGPGSLSGGPHMQLCDGLYRYLHDAREASKDADNRTVEWPLCLRKARRVHVSVSNENQHVSVWNLLFSLCQFLSSGHELQSLALDFPTNNRSGKLMDLYPVRLLGPLRELKVNGKDNEEGLMLSRTSPCSAAATSESLDSRIFALFRRIIHAQFQFWSALAEDEAIHIRRGYIDCIVCFLVRQESALKDLPRWHPLWTLALWWAVRSDLNMWEQIYRMRVYYNMPDTTTLSTFLRIDVDFLLEWQALGLDNETSRLEKLFSKSTGASATSVLVEENAAASDERPKFWKEIFRYAI